MSMGARPPTKMAARVQSHIDRRNGFSGGSWRPIGQAGQTQGNRPFSLLPAPSPSAPLAISNTESLRPCMRIWRRSSPWSVNVPIESLEAAARTSEDAPDAARDDDIRDNPKDDPP